MIDKNTKVRSFKDSDLIIGNEFLTKNRQNEWVPMKIRNREDLGMIIETFEKHPRAVFDMNFSPTSQIVLPSWYNITDDVVVYIGGHDKEYELEIPVLVYHEATNKVSMFLLNNTQMVSQIYQLFIGVSCETNNDLFHAIEKFGLNEKKAEN